MRKTSKFLNILLTVSIIFTISGCAAKASKTETTATLSCFGSCEAEFPDGTKIKKGIISFPNFTAKVIP